LGIVGRQQCGSKWTQILLTLEGFASQNGTPLRQGVRRPQLILARKASESSQAIKIFSSLRRSMSTLMLVKTDKYKRRIVGFGGKVLTDKKLPPLFLGQFYFQSIIFFVFVFSFSLFQRIQSENAVGGGWGVNSVNSLPKVYSKVC
jgi:hypothetical protein